MQQGLGSLCQGACRIGKPIILYYTIDDCKVDIELILSVENTPFISLLAALIHEATLPILSRCLTQ